MSYTPHPSKELQRIFREKPYQGAHPAEAEFLFIGLDANFDPEIEERSMWQTMEEYLLDGVNFWRTHGVHHPFMLPDYRGDGRKYHRNFADIGFTPDDADRVSFTELVHEPTVGRSSLQVHDLDLPHLEQLNHWIENGTSRYIFVPTSVATMMRASGEFAWMPKRETRLENGLGLWARLPDEIHGTKTVYWHYHFSVYGKFEEARLRQARAIGRLR